MSGGSTNKRKSRTGLIDNNEPKKGVKKPKLDSEEKKNTALVSTLKNDRTEDQIRITQRFVDWLIENAQFVLYGSRIFGVNGPVLPRGEELSKIDGSLQVDTSRMNYTGAIKPGSTVMHVLAETITAETFDNLQDYIRVVWNQGGRECINEKDSLGRRPIDCDASTTFLSYVALLDHESINKPSVIDWSFNENYKRMFRLAQLIADTNVQCNLPRRVVLNIVNRLPESSWDNIMNEHNYPCSVIWSFLNAITRREKALIDHEEVKTVVLKKSSYKALTIALDYWIWLVAHNLHYKKNGPEMKIRIQKECVFRVQQTLNGIHFLLNDLNSIIAEYAEGPPPPPVATITLVS